MPCNKNAMTRYKILDDLLSDKYHHYTLDELTEEVSDRICELYPESDGVVRRTIEKDIKYLKEGPFCAEIERFSEDSYDYSKGRNCIKQCFRYSDPNFSIFKKELSEDEKYLLKASLSLLGTFEGLPQLSGLSDLQNSLQISTDTRKIISLSKNPIEGSSILGELFTAISEKQVVAISYVKFTSMQEIHQTKIHPYLLKEYNNRWYVFGAAEDTLKIICFALDRITEVTPLPAHQYIEYQEDIQDIFEDIIGVTFNEKSPIYQIVFWVSDYSKEYVKTKPLHESQRKISKDKALELSSEFSFLKGGTFFEIECKMNYELIRELCSFGEELIVVKPSEVIQKIKERINKMSQNYQKL